MRPWKRKQRKRRCEISLMMDSYRYIVEESLSAMRQELEEAEGKRGSGRYPPTDGGSWRIVETGEARERWGGGLGFCRRKSKTKTSDSKMHKMGNHILKMRLNFKSSMQNLRCLAISSMKKVETLTKLLNNNLVRVLDAIEGELSTGGCRCHAT